MTIKKVQIVGGFIINLDEPDDLIEKRWRARVWMRQNPFANAMRAKVACLIQRKRAIIGGKHG